MSDLIDELMNALNNSFIPKNVTVTLDEDVFKNLAMYSENIGCHQGIIWTHDNEKDEKYISEWPEFIMLNGRKFVTFTNKSHHYLVFGSTRLEDK